jgi:hypothetical protein
MLHRHWNTVNDQNNINLDCRAHWAIFPAVDNFARPYWEI